MVRWYHGIISAYGFWLPNDPRGSWSDFIGAWELLRFGPSTKVDDKRSHSHDAHDCTMRAIAKASLKYPAVRFDMAQRNAIADGFRQAVREGNYKIHACCIGHDHSHFVTGRHERSIEQIAGHLKSKASMALRAAGCHPLTKYESRGVIPTPWSQGCWCVFLNEIDHVHNAIDYVNRHPMKEGLPRQHWEFVSEL